MPLGWALGGAAVADIVGSVIGGNAAQGAAQTQANAAQNATNAQLTMFNTTQQNLAPYMGSGTNALNALNFGLGIGPRTGGGTGSGAYGSLTAPFTAADYTKSPGYAFQFGEGINAVENSASAAGGIGGGNTLRALTQFGQGLAKTDYRQALLDYMAQQQQRYGMLQTAAGSGQNAAAGLGALSANVGQSIGSNIIGAGNALAAGQVGQANAWGGGLNSLAQLAYLQQLSGGGANPYGVPGYVPGDAGGGYGTGGNSALNDPNYFSSAYSDRDLKREIEPQYIDSRSGLTVYSYRYLWSRLKHLGYLAQEARAIYPDAVFSGPLGLMIDYAKIPSERVYSHG